MAENKQNIYDQPWYVYILECSDNTLYTGVAIDVEKRASEHNSTNKCRYTRFRKPVKVKYKELCNNHNIARKREHEIKGYTREQKLEIIAKYKN